MASNSFCSRSAGSHGSTVGSGSGVARRAAEGEFHCPARRHLVRALRRAEHHVDGGEGARAVVLQRIEGAGGGEAFQHALVDGARIDAVGEIGKVGERLLAARRRRSPRPPARRRL